MNGYEPVSLAQYCNAGAGVYGGNEPTTGRQVFRGLPFDIGSGDASR